MNFVRKDLPRNVTIKFIEEHIVWSRSHFFLICLYPLIHTILYTKYVHIIFTSSQFRFAVHLCILLNIYLAGEKPYECLICHKKYASKSGYNSHQKRYHNHNNINN